MRRDRKRWQHQPSVALGRPDLAGEWHSSNGWSPDEVTLGSARRILWRCRECGAEWHATVANRTYLESGCPVCATQGTVKPGATLMDKALWIALEFDIAANQLRPDQVAATSTMLAWWRCPECDHRWRASVSERVGRLTRCQVCAMQVRTMGDCLGPD